MSYKLSALVVVWALALVAFAAGAVQLSRGVSPAAPPDCARGERNYEQACQDACTGSFFKQCHLLGGTVACCYHFDTGQWECFCLWE